MAGAQGYAGTSSILAATVVGSIMQRCGRSPEAIQQDFGPVVGTLAHEVMMVLDQLLTGRYGYLQLWRGEPTPASATKGNIASTGIMDAVGGWGDKDDGPVQIASLLGHLLLLRSTGGLNHATALPDTFGAWMFFVQKITMRLPPLFCNLRTALVVPLLQAHKGSSVLRLLHACRQSLCRIWRSIIRRSGRVHRHV